MSDTTLTIDAAIKDRLERHRHDDHDSWTEVLESMMAVLPTYETIQDGCQYCGEELPDDVPIDEAHGALHWFQHPESIDGLGTTWCCSRECLAAVQAEVERQLPREPDAIRVGGHDHPPVEVESGLSFLIDGFTKEVGIDIPGAFAAPDGGWDYHGEPLYIKNQGEWVHSGVVEDVMHEESHTAILLGNDIEVEMSNHPDERKREEWHAEHGDDVADEAA